MSNRNKKENEKDCKNLLGKKKIKKFSKAQKKCLFCKKKKYLIRCIKCSKECCFDCIKELYYNEDYNFVEKEYVCIDCKNEDEPNKNLENIVCFLCGADIKEKNKHNYLVNEKQKLEFKNKSYNRSMLLDEKKENMNEEEYNIISICDKCYLNNFEMVDSILKKSVENTKNINETNKKMIGNNNMLFDFDDKNNNFLNILNILNSKNKDGKNENDPESKNIEIKNRNFDLNMKEENNNIKDKKINEQSLNYESINKDYLQKIFEINSFFKNMNALKNNNDNKIDNVNMKKSIPQNFNIQKNLLQDINTPNSFPFDFNNISSYMNKNNTSMLPNFNNNEKNVNNDLFNYDYSQNNIRNNSNGINK